MTELKFVRYPMKTLLLIFATGILLLSFLRDNPWYLPKQTSQAESFISIGFSFCYSEKHEQSLWVAYELDSSELIKVVERAKTFRADERIKEYTANNEDYANSGYDKGHLAPAADMSWSADVMKESFLFSNISPQLPAFNRGIWKRLEEYSRTVAASYGSVIIITGPVLYDGLKTIGSHEVSVPDFFYKVLLICYKSRYEGIAFLMKNAALQGNVRDYSVTIDSVERLTKIDFFEQLPNQEEQAFESVVHHTIWFNNRKAASDGGN